MALGRTRAIVTWSVVAAIGLWTATCVPALLTAGPESSLAPGDYIVTQESPAARGHKSNNTKESYIFHLTPSGAITVLAEPPQIKGPRGIRALESGQFIFADPLADAILLLSADGAVKTIYRGSPLTAPRDVAVDRDGSYVVADFATFKRNTAGSIFKITQAGKVLKIASGGELRWPHGIDVDTEGNYIVADHSGAVLRVSPQGQIAIVVKGEPLIAPTDLKVDREGNYIVADQGAVLDENGNIIREESRHPGRGDVIEFL